MSLIYSALNKLEQESGVAGTPDKTVANPYAATARKSGAPRWVYLVVLGCLLVVLGGWLSMSALKAKFAAEQVREPDRQPAPMPAVPSVPVPPIQFAETPVAVPAAVDLTVHTAPLRPEITASAPTSERMAEPAKAVQPKPRAQARPKPPAQVVTETAPVADEINPEETDRLTQAVKRAIQAGQNEEATNLLKQLATRLPPESITLLRLNAWHRMQSGDAAQAMALYRQIGERIPGDESAGINLALLNWKAGRQEEARRVIGALAERHPESETVQRYSRELGAPR